MEALQLARKDRRLHTATLPRTTTPTGRPPIGKKFMQTLDNQVYRELSKSAQQRGVTVQGLIRAVIVPEWVNSQENRTSIFSNPQPVAVENLHEQRIRTIDVEPTNTKGQFLVRRQ